MAAIHRFAWAGHALGVRVPDPEAQTAALIDRFLALDAAPAPANGAAACGALAASLRRAGRGWRIEGPFGAVAAGAREDALYALLEALAFGFARAAADRFVVHAGGIVADGGAVVLFGPAFSGKSSLAFAAWKRGLDVLGDDRLCLDAKRGAASAFPKCLKLRLAAGATGPAGRDGRAFGGDEAFVGALGGDRRLVLSRRLPGFVNYDSAIPIRAIAWLARDDRAAASRLEPMPATEALEGILGEATGADCSPMALVRLVKACAPGGRIARLRIAPGDLDRALDVLLAA